MIIGLHGLPQVGKDTVGEYLMAQGFSRIAFADKLKTELCIAFSLMHIPEPKDEPKNRLALVNCASKCFINFYQSTPEGMNELAQNADFDEADKHLKEPRSFRWLMQRWGDFRKCGNPNYWVNIVRDHIQNDLSLNYVVTDVRYINEAGMLHNLDAPTQIWQVTRAGVRADAHSSNLPLPAAAVDEFITNFSSLDALREATLYKLNKFVNII